MTYLKNHLFVQLFTEHNIYVLGIYFCSSNDNVNEIAVNIQPLKKPKKNNSGAKLSFIHHSEKGNHYESLTKKLERTHT